MPCSVAAHPVAGGRMRALTPSEATVGPTRKRPQTQLLIRTPSAPGACPVNRTNTLLAPFCEHEKQHSGKAERSEFSLHIGVSTMREALRSRPQPGQSGVHPSLLATDVRFFYMAWRSRPGTFMQFIDCHRDHDNFELWPTSCCGKGVGLEDGALAAIGRPRNLPNHDFWTEAYRCEHENAFPIIPGRGLGRWGRPRRTGPREPD